MSNTKVDMPQSLPTTIPSRESYTMPYNNLLPYAGLLRTEGEEWLQEICTQLAICVKAQDYAPGAISWVKQLNNFLDLKYTLPRTTRAHLARLLYELIVTPGVNTVLMDAFATCCIRLIKKPKRLGPEDLVLPWRPLYQVIDKYIFPKTRQRTFMAETKNVTTVIHLVEYAQRFFPAEATQEILEEFLPKFSTHSVSNALIAQGYIVLFLPPALPRHSTTQEPLYTPTTTSVSQFLPTLFSLWSVFTASVTFDGQFTELLSRIASSNLDTLTPSEVGLFTRRQVQTVYAAILRTMNLPVGSRRDGSTVSGAGGSGSSTGYGRNGIKTDMKAGNAFFLRRKTEKFRSFAFFIIYTLMPDQDNPDESYSLSLLEELIQAIELYYHPSNHGQWSYPLTAFAMYLAAGFIKRWREEQEPDCNTPQHCRLTPVLRQKFVLLLRPLTYLSMFGKDQYVVGTTQSTLKYLAWLEPSLIFPGLLERIYPSLETLTETHRTSSALSILSDVAVPLFSREHYPAGGKHLLPLLHLAIPGIDMNDPLKAVAALMFTSAAIITVPVIDLTSGDMGSNTNDFTYGGMDIDYDDGAAELPKEEEDRLCRASTGQFEEWLAKFLRRVFTMLENLPQQNQKKQTRSMETGLTQLLVHACDVVFEQLTGKMYDLALRMVSEFASEQVLPNATHAIGLICESISSANPEKGLRRFVPLCIDHIKTELEHGASSIITNASSSTVAQSDATLHWYQKILFGVVATSGTHLLTYKTELVDILQEMFTHCRSRRGYMWAAKLLRACLRTLLDIYPKDFCSLTPEQWADPDTLNASHLLWGKPGDPENVNIDWHVPSEEEKAFALELLERFLTPAMNTLQNLMSDDPAVSKPTEEHELTNAFCKNFSVVRSCLLGSVAMINDDGVDNVSENQERCASDEGSVGIVKTRSLVGGYAFSDPSSPGYHAARTYRRKIAELTHQSLSYFRQHREDDVESIKMIIKTARAFLEDLGVQKSQYEDTRSGYHFTKSVFKTILSYKQYPRSILVRRVFMHHWERLRQNVSGRIRTPLHDGLLMELTLWSLSAYAEIRKMSQNALSASARNFLGSKSLLIPVLLDAMQAKPDVDKTIYSNQIKGALYLFRHKSIISPCLRDWRFVPQFVMALCRAQHEDKTSIQELIRKVFVDYITRFTASSLHIIVSEDIDTLADAVSSPTHETLGQVALLREKVQESERQKVESYQGLLQQLLEFLQDPRVHWRFATMAANLVEFFIRAELPLTSDLATVGTQALVSELPAMRRIGVSMVTQLLLYIKQRTLAQGNTDLLVSRTTRNPLKRDIAVPENAADLGQQLLAQSYQPITNASCLLVDNTVTGWYVWPKTYTAYVPFSSADEFPPIDESSRGCYDTLLQSFSSSDYWAKLLQYTSQEITRAQEDNFSIPNARLYCSVFQMYRDGPIPAVKEHLIRLCEASDQKNHQRAAAELAGGIIRGSKHWSLQEKDALWQWMTPLLQKTLAAVTPDSLGYWEKFTRYCCTNRDPRRILPLIEIIAGAEFVPNSDAAFAESRKLLLVRQLLKGLKWRALPIGQRVLPTYLAHVDHPYKQVREVLGGNINELLQLYWVPSVPNVTQLLNMNASNGDGVDGVPITEIPEIHPLMLELYKKLDAVPTNSDTEQDSAAVKDCMNASKTVLCWLNDGLSHWRVVGILPYVVPLLHRVFSMQEFHDDQDLHQLASRVLNLMAQFAYPPQLVDIMISQYVDIMTKSSNWHIRIRTLPVLQVFFFKNLFIMRGQQLLRIMDVISDMLMDSQIEVRQVAAITLGGLVRCSQRDAITRVKSTYAALLQTKIPKRQRDRTTGKLIEPAGFRDALLKKHAGALGLSCLVSAFPYEVPQWMPEVLCQLADCISDPAEIQATIRKTFTDFRRTHSDTWHEDMMQFTEDQLSMLSDMLISPSYYA